MTNTLDQICAVKRTHVEQRKAQISIESLKDKISKAELPRGFLKRLKSMSGTALITEVKKASPSKGVIRDDFDPAVIAGIYQNAGAACISVLTDTPYFQGKDEDLIAVKQSVSLPVLRKDFMIDPYQIYESRVLGADCILLIIAALQDKQAQDLYGIAVDLGMDVLVEVHDLPELERAVALRPMMIGVNNRNLKTLRVDLQTSYDISAHIPQDVYKISESGIADNQTLRTLQSSGYQGFLIGESLMRERDIDRAMKLILGKPY